MSKRIAVMRGIKTLATRSERSVLVVYECHPPFLDAHSMVCVTTDSLQGLDRAVVSIAAADDMDRSDSDERPSGAIVERSNGECDMAIAALENHGYEICLGHEIVLDGEMFILASEMMNETYHD